MEKQHWEVEILLEHLQLSKSKRGLRGGKESKETVSAVRTNITTSQRTNIRKKKRAVRKWEWLRWRQLSVSTCCFYTRILVRWASYAVIHSSHVYQCIIFRWVWQTYRYCVPLSTTHQSPHTIQKFYSSVRVRRNVLPSRFLRKYIQKTSNIVNWL